jgi:hypothetical protein
VDAFSVGGSAQYEPARMRATDGVACQRTCRVGASTFGLPSSTVGCQWGLDGWTAGADLNAARVLDEPTRRTCMEWGREGCRFGNLRELPLQLWRQGSGSGEHRWRDEVRDALHRRGWEGVVVDEARRGGGGGLYMHPGGGVGHTAVWCCFFVPNVILRLQ